ncbi:MAG: helix-turn-helix domain-containing protein [Leadbetterella sp.]
MTPSEIKSLRLSLGMTQAEFAKAVGVTHKRTVCNWEKGHRKPDRYFQMKLEELNQKAATA